MKTFESERGDLHEWMWVRIKEHEDAISAAPLVLDGDYDAVAKHRKDIEGYNRRLRELKKKYGMD